MIRMTKAIATTAKQPKVPRAAVRATDGLSLSWISTTSCWVTGSIFVTRVCFFLEENAVRMMNINANKPTTIMIMMM